VLRGAARERGYLRAADLTAHGTAEIEVSHDTWQLYRASRIGAEAIVVRIVSGVICCQFSRARNGPGGWREQGRLQSLPASTSKALENRREDARLANAA
jgi:hypothetical protein